MKDKEENIDDTEKEASPEQANNAEQPPVNKGKRVLLLLLPVVIVLLSAVAYFLISYFKTTETEVVKEEIIEEKSYKYLYYDIDKVIVALISSPTKRNFLKISVSLQVRDENTVKILQEKGPIIKDAFQLFLRELKAEELTGSSGILMIKQELLKRVNKIIAPDSIQDILFKELLLS